MLEAATCGGCKLLQATGNTSGHEGQGSSHAPHRLQLPRKRKPPGPSVRLDLSSSIKDMLAGVLWATFTGASCDHVMAF